MAIAEPSTGDAPEIEDGLYEVTCTEVSDPFEELDFNGKKLIKKVRIFFQIHGTDDGEGNEEVLDPKVNLKWSPGGDYPASTLYLFATALCGSQDADVPFDTDNLVGKKARATIKTDPGKWPRIRDLMPPLKANGKSAPTSPVEAAGASQPSNPLPSIINFMGEVDWPKFWAEADAICGDREKAKAAVVAQLGGDLLPLETMEVTLVVDLLDVLRTNAAVPF